MRNKRTLGHSILTLSCVILWSSPAATAELPVGTAFTYQGELQQGGSAASGTFVIDFSLFAVGAGGAPIAPTESKNVTPDPDGRFTVTLDFGVDPYTTNEARWLHIVVDGSPLIPRQELTPAPFSQATRGLNVDSAGNVGIGTANPAATLTINQGTAGLWTDGIRLISGANFWDIRASSGFLRFGLNESAKVTFKSDGNVGIGTTNPGFKLEVNGSAGKPGGGSWTNSSDRRLKRNIRDMDGALDKLRRLRGVTFEYKDPEAINELPGERIGMIAQEVEDVFPDWVDVNGRGHKTVTYRGFEALTVEALRELREEKDAELAALRSEMEDRIAALEKKLSELGAKVGE